MHLPPGIWYDYWTGAKLDRRAPIEARDLEIRDAKGPALKPVMVDPGPAELPVYVREGAILPMSPVVQSTGEKPSGPLTLRVFPGENCAGSIYQDDGTTYEFRRGVFFRQLFTCAQAADGSVTVSLSGQEGTYSPWWSAVRIEVVGLASSTTTAMLGGKSVAVEKTSLGKAVTIPRTAKAQSITLH